MMELLEVIKTEAQATIAELRMQSNEMFLPEYDRFDYLEHVLLEVARTHEQRTNMPVNCGLVSSGENFFAALVD